MPKLMDVVNKDIVYYRLAYACEFHGEYRSKGKVKPNHLSKRRGCPMRILLRLAEDLHHLVVYELYEQHNHELEPRDETKTPKQQMFRMARVNSSRYMLTKLEEGEGGQFVDIETSVGSQIFDDEDEGNDSSSSPSKLSTSVNTPVARLIGNATKRILTASDLKSGDVYQDLKRRKLLLQTKKLELETKKLELENKKLEIELKLLEKRNDDDDQGLGGNTYYVSHVIDDSKDGISDATSAFPSSAAAEVIKSLTGRGQPIQIITQ
uniref:ZSWIM3 N-terminal domain-containing protein n=1 Tax=Arion vulgaris TaxID=1028688 RepID=A0A0B7A6U3_9EUPU